MASNVPSIRLIVPTPDVSAVSDPNSSIASRVPAKKKSMLAMFSGGSVSSAQTPYNTMRGAGDLSDIVRRVGGDGSVSGRGWEVHVDSDINEATVRRQSAEGEGMVLIKKKVKTRGRIDGVFADATNTRPESPQPIETGPKDKWWTISRGRKDTGGKEGGVLGLMRRGKCKRVPSTRGLALIPLSAPGPSLPPTPTLDVPQRQPRVAEMQTHLPGDPDCTLDMVDVPSLRGRAVAKDLPRQQQPFPAQKRFNSLGASSVLAPTPQPRTEYQRSVSAGSAALLSQSQSHPLPQYAHMPGASTPYATMQRIEMYQPPVNSKPTLSKPPQRSASAMGVYAPSAPPEFKRSLSALAGSGIVLGAPASTLGRAATPTPLSRAPTPVPGLPTPALLNVPGKEKDQGSIALRAMRSVRSMARIGTRGDEKEEGEGTVKGKKVKTTKTKEDGKEEKKKKEKEEQKKKEKNKRPPKSSGSSFEAGALGTSPVQRKRSILGLGLGMSATIGKSSGGKSSSTGIGMGLPSALSMGRNAGGKASTASSVGGSGSGYVSHANPTTNPNRLSADAPGNPRRESTNSSLRPISVLSSGSSSGSRVSSGSSVRWAEEVVDKMRTKKGEKDKKDHRDSKHSLEGRKRTPLSDVFPSLSRRSSAAESTTNGPPMLTLEEATTDGHGHDADDDEEMEDGDFQIISATPVKCARPRPVSDDMRPRPRPRGMIEATSATAGGLLNLLDAATNDLAQLITHLDLDATPSPGRAVTVPIVEESPISKNRMLRPSEGSVSSLRPYAERASLPPKQLVAKASQRHLLGQQIAPWPSSPEGSPPVQTATPSETTFKRAHHRTMTPSPEPEPAPVFQPLRLRPSRIRPTLTLATSASPSPPPSSADDKMDMRAPSSLTFGSRSSSGSAEEGEGAVRTHPLPPVFTRHNRNRSSLLPNASPSPRSSKGSTNGMPLARGAKRVLGMAGTMGGSQASDYEEQELDASDPDSDIPNELQVILSASRATSPVDDTLSFFPPQSAANTSLPSPGLPPADLPPPPPAPQLELPVFNLQLIEDDGHQADVDDGALSEEDTKRSFDFTGELQKLNESGASDRRSFVEQLENAFKTPAKIELRDLLAMEVPAVPPIPFTIKPASSPPSFEEQQVPHSVSRLMDVNEPTMAVSSDGVNTMDMIEYPEYPSPIIDFKEPTLLPGSDSLGSDDSLVRPPRTSAGPSNGQLNVGFKFGGQLPGEKKPEPKPRKQLTLSDILPPPSHVRAQSLTSLMEEDDSVLKSIFAHAADIDIAQPRARVNSDSSLRRSAIENSRASMIGMHSRTRSRPASGISFTGFDSFDEVRRGFEFHPNRPTFYPPPAATRNTRAYHGQHDSVFSIASVSSYGHVTNPGINDPFEYGLPMPSLREHPSSEDLSVSMSINVDDTFSFLGRDPHRKRVASDASSFYFKAPSQQPSRGHRHRESNVSVSSQGGPPVSFYNYNRSFGNHRLSEADTSTSGSSLAHQYASQGAAGGRAAWAQHRQDSSVDSVLSDFSVARLGRPGVGDKMFDTAYDRSMPLSAISASPPESRSDFRNHSSYDSIMDEGRGSSMEDSLFEKTGHRSSMSSDSVFGYDDHHPPNGHLLPPNQFRPLSMLSMNNSTHSPMREDDTMITMLGGGHVRRRSIGSVFEASPCVRVEKRKHATFQEDDNEVHKARIVTQPSIASTFSSKFGDERMIRAKQGLLVRQSLEESALMADGEVGLALRHAPVFSRPSPDSRSRSSTITTSSSGADTPPLSSAENSSMSDGSQSSIDMSEVSIRLANTTHPVSSSSRTRARARGNGHRRRMSAAQSRASRSSVYETIHEEYSSPAPSHGSKKSSSPTACQGVFVVPADSGSMDFTPGASMGWDDERGIDALRKYYALRHEAQDAVTESQRTWLDTPFSLFAIQTFQPPKHPEGMQALLQHSVQSYGPLPSELGPRRVHSRTQSRASPYPARQALSQTPNSPNTISHSPRPSPEELNRAFMSPGLQSIEFDPNVEASAPSFLAMAMLSPAGNNKGWNLPNARPRVPSAARRSALGWAKRNNKASNDLKENNISGISLVMSPTDSLRLSRPRPRGRPTPARPGRQAVPVA
ncbi:hypothetical protein C8F01DRAFT_1149410 [Mycena amicta]|nr:hypothetical protein C8F01DRAFT_1149410 [Mycena amicta]